MMSHSESTNVSDSRGMCQLVSEQRDPMYPYSADEVDSEVAHSQQQKPFLDCMIARRPYSFLGDCSTHNYFPKPHPIFADIIKAHGLQC
jgi:hypothetical protein